MKWMTLAHHHNECNQCKQKTLCLLSTAQCLLGLLLMLLFILPGIIYLLVAKGRRCYKCGLYYDKQY